MNQKILVSLPHEMVQEQKDQITDRLNSTLAPILTEVKSWNGFIDFQENGKGNYDLIARCDNDEVRQRMQELINLNIEDLY